MNHKETFIYKTKYWTYSVREKDCKYLIYYTKYYNKNVSFYDQGEYECVKLDEPFYDLDNAVEFCKIKEKEEYWIV